MRGRYSALKNTPDGESELRLRLEKGILARMKSLCCAAVIFWGLGKSFGVSLEWPEFRGPTGQGISTATNVPVSWSATNNILWKVEVPEGWSSPVVSNGRIFLTGSTREEGKTSLRALALDLASGKSLWDMEVFRVESPGATHRKNGFASPAPIVRDGKVFVHFGYMGTAALDLDGKVIWKQIVSWPSVHGNGGSPILIGDTLVMSCDGATEPFLVGLKAKTGEIKWKTPRETHAKSKFSHATALAIEMDGRSTVVSPASGFVGGYEPETGKEIWRARYGEGYSVVVRPVFAHGLLFLSSGFDRPITYAIDPRNASGDITEKGIVWQQPKGAPSTPSALVVGDELYIVSDAGIATCFDARTGETHWSERLGGGFSASPAVAEGRIYFQNEEGLTTVIKAGKTFEVLSKNDMSERSLASPAIIDNTIVLRTASHIWRIGK